MNSTYGIPIACVTFSILLLWLLIGTKGYWILKMFVIAFSLYFFACLWASLNGLLGWPTEETIVNKKIQLLWIDVKEPNKSTNNNGAIYVWVKHLSPVQTANRFIKFHKQSVDDPRAYKLKYSREMHKQAIQTMQKIAKGEKVYGEMQEGEGQGQGQKSEKNVKDGKDGKDQGSLSQEQEMMFHQLPPPYFPVKQPQ